jgi:O-antigen/teichoic acid export membrane protein
MRIGRTTAIHFASKFGSSIIGFIAMVYFARVLGSGELGVYFLIISLVGWLKLGSNMGISLALMKRISEGEDKNQHLVAALSLVIVAFAVISLGVYLFQVEVNSYLGGDLYVYVILLLASDMAFKFVNVIMKGEHLVHAQGIVSISKAVLRVAFQVATVVLGLGAIGLVLGKAAATGVISVIAVVLILTYFGRSFEPNIPSRSHYRSIIDYAKFSWLGSMKGKMYNRMDIIVLGVFVPSNLIGIYSICWNVASVLEIFSKSLSTTLFPEISKVSTEDGTGGVTSYVEDSLTYAGLIIIPGFVGATVVGGGILNIYGGEFTQGYLILVILVGSTLIHSYHKQFMNTMDAINRPDLTFFVNIFFAGTNITLNFVLVYLHGWTGAAVATLVSVTAAMLLAYRMLSRILNFSVPYVQIFYQVLSAMVMGILVYGLLSLLGSFGVDVQRVIPVLVAVGFGALVYFICLLLVSRKFRDIVLDNLSRNK